VMLMLRLETSPTVFHSTPPSTSAAVPWWAASFRITWRSRRPYSYVRGPLRLPPLLLLAGKYAGMVRPTGRHLQVGPYPQSPDEGPA
jgi:hypothetical protein